MRHTLYLKLFVLILFCGGSLVLNSVWASPHASVVPVIQRRAEAQRLTPADLQYKGAFAYPAGDEWAYSGHALAYYPGGDATGADDGYPGSLFAVGHAWVQQVGEINIPASVITTVLDALPRSTVLQAQGDITGGWINHCTYDPGCEYREVAGLEYLENLDKIAWNLRDWYNVDGGDQDSLGWSERNLSNAQGVWHIGPRNNEAFHNAKTSDYLFKAPLGFADQHLGSKWLIAGSTRAAGGLGGSQGPTLFATAPWVDGNPPASGQNLDALALLYYPTVVGCVENNDDALCLYPHYRADDSWGGGAWVEAGGKSAVILMGRKGLGASCYGIPGEQCPTSLCTTDKGWHADPYEPQILFYDPAELAAVAAGAKEPWTVLPYATYRPVNELLRPDCGILNAVAYDAARHLIYATESQAGPGGETVVHVWEVQNGDNNGTPTSVPTATVTSTPAPTASLTNPVFLPVVAQE